MKTVVVRDAHRSADVYTYQCGVYDTINEGNQDVRAVLLDHSEARSLIWQDSGGDDAEVEEGLDIIVEGQK